MRKASRLFEIIQILRLAPRPVTAARIAERLEVATRSVYRDIAALQAMRVPIEGERGIGYVLRPGFVMPPLMFTVEEAEALVLSLALLDRTGDPALRKAARSLDAKVAAVVPDPLRRALLGTSLHAWGAVAPPPGMDLAAVRQAIRDERVTRIAYRDEAGRDTDRAIRPIALIYYPEAVNIVAWCELRGAIRHFRAERVRAGEVLERHFRGEGDRLRREWMAGWVTNPHDESAPVAA